MSFSVHTQLPDEEDLEIARTELRETPEIVQAALVKLRELLRNNTSLYYKDDDETLTIFLRPCKWYPKSAFELMKRIADFKEKNKDELMDLTPDAEKEALTTSNVVNVLKERDHKGRRVLIVNSGKIWDPSKVSSTQIFRLFFLIHTLAVLEPKTQIRGIVVIMNFKDMGMMQVRCLTPAYSLLLLSFIQDAIPLRLKEVHILNESFIFNIAWSLFKPFIRKKLKERIFFHKSKMSSLHTYLEPSHLPADFGGQLPAIDYSGANWYPVLMDNVEHVKTFTSFGKRK